MPATLSLDEWAEAQARISAAKMAECISATSIVKHRPGFGQTVRPAKGSVIAAIGSAHSETEPDYFFHWLRDSAVIMDAALMLAERGIDADAWRQRFAEFVRFSLDLRADQRIALPARNAGPARAHRAEAAPVHPP